MQWAQILLVLVDTLELLSADIDFVKDALNFVIAIIWWQF